MNRMGVYTMIAFTFLFARCGNDPAPSNSEPAAKDSTTTAPPSTFSKTILFFGNSLTAGYGVDPSEAFPALIQQKIDSAQLAYKVINGGVSGETTAGGNQRIDFVLKQQPVDVFVLELGANDGLRGVPLAETRTNLQSIVDKVKRKYPNAKLVLAGMQIPPNMGQVYAADFGKIYPGIAAKNNMTLIPFLLEGVGGELRLNQQDGIHPTAEGYQLVAANVWKVLQGIL